MATSTEVSAFAVVYALVVGGLAFRELTARSLLQLLVRSASMAGSVLFIVAAASSVSFALTIQQIPQYLSDALVALGHGYGAQAFMTVAALLMIAFGAVLEGAPALIIFGPLLAPIAQQLGVHPLHFGTVMVIAMGLGLFSPPVGLGLFATCAITGTRLQDVARPDGEVSRGAVPGADGAGAGAGVFALAARAVRAELTTRNLFHHRGHRGTQRKNEIPCRSERDVGRLRNLCTSVPLKTNSAFPEPLEVFLRRRRFLCVLCGR